MPSSSRKASPAKSASPKATRSQTKRGAKDSEPEAEDDSARGDRGVVPPSSLVPRGDPASVAALAELKSLLDRFPPETLQALVTRPASVTRPLQEEERRSTSLRLLDCVDSDVYHLLDEAARLRLDDARADIVYADQRFWTGIFESVRPAADAKPDLSDYPHSQLVDFRPKKVPADVTNAFRSNAKLSATDDVLRDLHDKQIRPLTRLAMTALDLAQEDLPSRKEDLVDYARVAKQSLTLFAQYVLMLHSDVVYRRKMASMMAIGLTEAEATGAPSLLSNEDRDKMKAVVESRKQISALQSGLGKRKRQPFGRGRGRGAGRRTWGGRSDSDGGSRDGKPREDGDGAKDSTTDKSSKDSSENQSQSTPAKGSKKSFQRGGKKK